MTGGASAEEQAWDDLKKFGVTDAQIADLRESRKDHQSQAASFAVWPENWHALVLFNAMATQWRCVLGASAIYWLGLDYAALEAVEKRIEPHPLAPAPSPARLFEQLRLVEQIALQERNNRT